jgi:phage replication-related protein YjqB (UPF0714/DUF867 family)
MPPQRFHRDAAEMTVPRRRDSYASFADLARVERENVDFRIRSRRRNSPVTIIAPHGGKIEPGTSEIAEAIAADNYSFYCFEGLKTHDNRRLHLTSTHFDEPIGVALVTASDYVVAIHGFTNADRLVYMGGLDETLKNHIDRAIKRAGVPTESSGRMHLQAMSPKNICNRGKRGKGAQLEISRNLRDDLAHGSGHHAQLAAFASAVRKAIAEVVRA